MIYYSYERIARNCKILHDNNNRIVFTNGCFDLFHYGHLDSLVNARSYGNILIVGINSDYSVKCIKGNERPFIPEHQRAEIVHSIKHVNHVFVFDEQVPIKLIEAIQPDTIVKGEEYSEEELKSMTTLLTYPCEIKTIKKVPLVSTTSIIERIQKCT